jgi:hypothetical protein
VARGRRTEVGLGLESDPIAREGTGPTGWTHLSARERGKGKEAGCAGKVGLGGVVGPCGGKEKTRRREAEGWAA